jgi:hypothetical protein
MLHVHTLFWQTDAQVPVILTFCLLFLRFFCYSYVLSVILTFCLLFLRFVCYSYVLSVNLTFGLLSLPSFTKMAALPGYRFSKKQFAKTLDPGVCYFYVLPDILTFCLTFLRFAWYSYVLSVHSCVCIALDLTTYRLMVLLHVVSAASKLQFLLL